MSNLYAHKPRPVRVLRVDASARHAGSTTRALSDALIDALRRRHGDLTLVRRDLSEGLPFIDERWVAANFTAPEQRDGAQQAALAGSDALVSELQDAEVVVIGVPIYNFGIPAALKAWIDQVARARLTFRYTPQGPLGLLAGKKAYLVVASSGTDVDGPIDFATPYLRHVLGFLGITDVEIVSADRQTGRGADAVADARSRIETIAAEAVAA